MVPTPTVLFTALACLMDGGGRIYVGIWAKNTGIGLHLESSHSDEHYNHMELHGHFIRFFLSFTTDPRSPVPLMEEYWLDLRVKVPNSCRPIPFPKDGPPASPSTAPLLHHLRVEIPSLKSSPGPEQSSEKLGSIVVGINKCRSFWSGGVRAG